MPPSLDLSRDPVHVLLLLFLKVRPPLLMTHEDEEVTLILRVPPLVERPPPSRATDFVGPVAVEDFHGLLELGARAGAVDGGGQGEDDGAVGGSGHLEMRFGVTG